MSSNQKWIGISLVAALTLATLGFALTRKPAFRAALIDPPLPAAEINLAATHNANFQLSDYRGKVVLLYFGYVHCPMECPMTMAHLKLALERLGNKAQDIQVVMITTDPAHDTLETLTEFLGHFNPSFIGVTGTADELKQVYRDYSVYVLENGTTHASYTYVLDRSGNIRLTFVPDTTPEDIAHDLKILLNSQE